MTYQAEQFSHFIGEIYDAAIEASRCSSVLGKAAKFIGGNPGGRAERPALGSPL
jgi:hypothetical protein